MPSSNVKNSQRNFVLITFVELVEVVMDMDMEDMVTAMVGGLLVR